MSTHIIAITIGVCILYIGVVIFILMRHYYPTCCKCCKCCKYYTSTPQISKINNDPYIIVKKELSPQSFEDFIDGTLIGGLYNEIRNLYILKGQLDEYIMCATKLNHKYLIMFLNDPIKHPLIIAQLSVV